MPTSQNHRRNMLKSAGSFVALTLLASVLPKGAFATNSTPYEAVNFESLLPKDWNPYAELQDLIDQGVMNMADDEPLAKEYLEKQRKIWDSAPTVAHFNHKKIRIFGYVVPLESNSQGISEFLLVPYFGACIHSPPPPSNQIIHIKLEKPSKGGLSMDYAEVYGLFNATNTNSDLGSSGYSMKEAYLVDTAFKRVD